MRKLLLAGVAVLGASIGLSSVADAQSAAPSPAPGTITVRLNGKVRTFFGYASQSDFNTPFNKLDQGVAMTNYMRLYPGFDGVAANGLKYGAAIELRQDSNQAITASPSGQASTRGEVYVRRAYGYIGTDQLGTLRFGQTDGPASLFIQGTMENFNDGAWNGDAPAQLVGNAQFGWPFADQGNEYTSEKLVYLSPQFYGFDFGFSYAPTSNGSGQGAGCNFAGAGCLQLSSSNIPSEWARPRNTLEAGVRYRGAFGAFGVAANANYAHSGKVLNSSNPGTVGANTQFNGLNLGDVGLQVTYGGLLVGGNIQFGEFNGGWSLKPSGGADGLAWTAGASYGVGPWIIGASYINYKSEGAFSATTPTGQLAQQGVAAGGTYNLAPGLALYLDYLWVQKREGNVNLATGAIGSSDHNSVRAQYIGVGTSLTW